MPFSFLPKVIGLSPLILFPGVIIGDSNSYSLTESREAYMFFNSLFSMLERLIPSLDKRHSLV